MSIAEPVMVLKIKCTLFQLVSTNIYKIQNYLCQQMKNSIFHPWVWEDLTLPDLGGSFCPILEYTACQLFLAGHLKFNI